LIEVSGLVKTYDTGGEVIHALDGIDLAVESGEFVAVMGASGSGKSTFMNILGCLDRPTEGRYVLDGTPVEKMGKDELAAIRNLKIGFVFQGFNLLPRTNAIENVELPLIYTGISAHERRARSIEALRWVGLENRAGSQPNQLSGGQQQRVAIARALVNRPELILADEPTGNLDTKTSSEVMEVFCRLNSEQGMTIVLVTHEEDIAEYAGRRLVFRDGRVVSDTSGPAAGCGGNV